MTLQEFLGVVGATLFAILTPIAAGLLGYGLIGILVAIPVGFLLGWVVGGALTYPIMRLLYPPKARPKLSDSVDASEPSDD